MVVGDLVLQRGHAFPSKYLHAVQVSLTRPALLRKERLRKNGN
jgi:hypothetical protein